MDNGQCPFATMKYRPTWASAVLLCWLMNGFSLGGGRPVEIRDRQVFDLSGSPHRVTRDIVVEDSGELVIEPGVELRFAPGVGIVVNGVLKAQVYEFLSSPLLHARSQLASDRDRSLSVWHARETNRRGTSVLSWSRVPST